MAELQRTMRCKSCGEPLDALAMASTDGLVECPCCHNVYTLPKKEIKPATLDCLRQGEHDLDTCRFDDAYTAYSKATEYDGCEPEAYWGMALAEFKVQYIKDGINNRLQPICHEFISRAFVDNKNYQTALKYATDKQKLEYINKAKAIDYIRNKFTELKKSGLDYDCFICVKVTDDETKEPTRDAHFADGIYDHLKEKGVAPFYSEKDIRTATGDDYEARILYALYVSSCMLIVCSKEEYLRTPWVQNEYTRFLSLINNDEKENSSVTFVFKDNPIEKLPGKNGKIQGIDLGKPDAYNRIEEYVTTFSQFKKKVDFTISRKNYDDKVYKRKNIQREGVKKRQLVSPTVEEISVSDKGQLKVVKNMMNDRCFEPAFRYCDNMIENNPSNGEAYFLRFLSNYGFVSEEELYTFKGRNIFTGIQNVDKYEDFEKAIAATQDVERRNRFYELLVKRVTDLNDINAYNEYIVLPDSDEKQIKKLTDLMYREAKKSLDCLIFDSVIKTVDNTNKYIAMNREFADLLLQQKRYNKAVGYYRNILGVDEGDDEALYRVFEYNHDCNSDAVFAYACLDENREALEKELFSYRFNLFAVKNLFALCCSHVEHRAQDSCRLFDFLLSIIPQKENELFMEYLNLFISKLFYYNKINFIAKYNDLMLANDKMCDAAYFNKVMLKYGYNNAISLVRLNNNKLLQEPDYMSAMNIYVENNPSAEKNLYLEINKQIEKIAEILKDEELLRYAEQKYYVTRENLMSCYDGLLAKLGDEAKNLINVVEQRNGGKNIKTAFHWKKNISKDKYVLRAYKFAQAGGDKDLSEILFNIIDNQAATAKKHQFNDKMSGPKIFSVVYFLLCELLILFEGVVGVECLKGTLDITSIIKIESVAHFIENFIIVRIENFVLEYGFSGVLLAMFITNVAEIILALILFNHKTRFSHYGKDYETGTIVFLLLTSVATIAVIILSLWFFANEYSSDLNEDSVGYGFLLSAVVFGAIFIVILAITTGYMNLGELDYLEGICTPLMSVLSMVGSFILFIFILSGPLNGIANNMAENLDYGAIPVFIAGFLAHGIVFVLTGGIYWFIVFCISGIGMDR